MRNEKFKLPEEVIELIDNSIKTILKNDQWSWNLYSFIDFKDDFEELKNNIGEFDMKLAEKVFLEDLEKEIEKNFDYSTAARKQHERDMYESRMEDEYMENVYYAN